MLPPNLHALLAHSLGAAQILRLSQHVAIAPLLRIWEDGIVSRAELAQAFATALFHGLETRLSPDDSQWWDTPHGPLRVLPKAIEIPVVRWKSGHLSDAGKAFTRLLGPLGYLPDATILSEYRGVIRKVYRHIDAPEQITQLHVCEVRPLTVSEEFALAVDRIVSRASDRLAPQAVGLLNNVWSSGGLPLDDAKVLLQQLVASLGRSHPTPVYEDYRVVMAESPEMAWIATEGLAARTAVVSPAGGVRNPEPEDVTIGEDATLHREFVCASGVRIRRSVHGPRISIRAAFSDSCSTWAVPRCSPGRVSTAVHP